MYVGEAYIKREEKMEDRVVEMIAGRRDLYIYHNTTDQFYEEDIPSDVRKTIDSVVTLLDKFSWRDPSVIYCRTPKGLFKKFSTT